MVKIRVFVNYKYLLCLLTGFLIGLLLGVMSTSILVSYRVDKYHERISYLEAVIEEKNIQLDALEKSINKKKFIIKKIDIIVLNEEAMIDKIGLEKHIREKYNKLVGEEVRNINLDLVSEVIDRRIMRLSGKTYKLKVERILLSETLTLWVEVEVEAETGLNM